MSIKTAFSSASDIQVAINSIKENFDGIIPKVVLYFASASYDPNGIAEAMQKAFPASTTVGCSTAGEIVSGKMLKNSIVAMAFDSETIVDAKAVVMKNIKSGNTVKQAFAKFEEHFGENSHNMDFNKYIGIVLIDGLSGAEEGIMDTIGDMTNVQFIGASAGDDLKFSTTYVYAGAKAHTNAGVLLLLKPNVEFSILKTQSFKALDKQLLATKVDEATRTVIEFNNKPAVEAYAEAIGINVDDVSNHFMSNPVGLMMDDEPYVRSPQRVEGNKMVFYCQVLEGMELSLLESGDIVATTKTDLDKKIADMGGISGLINFHCILRTLQLEEQNQTEAYAEIFSDIPMIGFSTYGEEYIGHINQTSTMLLFK